MAETVDDLRRRALVAVKELADATSGDTQFSANQSKDDPRRSLEDVRRGATDALRELARSLSLRRRGTAAAVAMFAALASTMQFVAGDGEVKAAGWIGIVATSVIFVFAIIATFTSTDSASELGAAHDAIYRAHEAIAESEAAQMSIAAYQMMFDKMTTLLIAQKGMLEFIRTSCSVTIDVDMMVPLVFKAGARNLSIAAGLSLDDEWTICIYRAVSNGDDCRMKLELYEDTRAIPCSREHARSWPEGQGAAGIAYAKGEEVIIDDLTADSIRSLVETRRAVRAEEDPENERRPDVDRYKSIVAVPIHVAQMDAPWGVVCATNSRVGHFNHSQQTGLKPEEAIRALAAYVGLAISVCGCRSAAGQNMANAASVPKAEKSTRRGGKPRGRQARAGPEVAEH